MCWYPSRRVSQLLHFNIALQYIYFMRQNIPIHMLFLEGTTYIMQKTSNKSLQQVILLFQGVVHSSYTGNNHCICMQVVFLVVLRYICHKKEYPIFYAFLSRHDLYYAKKKSINSCNKLLHCFGGSVKPK